MTEQEKCLMGLWYDANNDPELLARRSDADELCFLFNQTNPKNVQQKESILKKLIPQLGKDITILSPFYADYGYNCVIGDHTFINHNAYFMDCAPITVGSFCFIGPNCGLYTGSHPLNASQRNQGYEKANPITIGKNVWIGGDVTILPGVTIGDGSVIGAKSVVTKDIPPGVLAVGNPCRVLRPITNEDMIPNLS